jgi:two-component system, OmpR family, response regulator
VGEYLPGCPSGREQSQKYFAMRVLCVDDNRDLADSVGLLLQLVGHDVRVCYDGFQAVREARDFLPHVCLIDLQLPGMGGDEVARVIKQTASEPSPYLIAITAMGGDLHRIVTREAGFDLHLVKPVSPTELIAILESRRSIIITCGGGCHSTDHDIRPVGDPIRRA